MNNPPQFGDRLTTILQLPLEEGLTVLHPEQVILRVDRTTFDIGVFCFTVREPFSPSGRTSRRRKAVLESLLPHRPEQIRQVVHYLSSLLTDKGLRNETVTTVFKYFAAYLNWADSNGYFNCLGSDAEARSILEAWFLECEEQYRKGAWSGPHAWANQSGISILLSAITNQPDLQRGLRFIRFRSTNAGTEPAPEGDFALVLAINEALFIGLADLLIHNRPYPFKLNMPKLPGWEEAFLWVFPTHRWYLPPHLQGEERAKLPMPLWSYDYINGCIASLDDIKHHFKMPCLARFSLQQAQNALERANTNPRSVHRRQAARAAHDAFFLLFIAHTGLNEAVARDIRWEREITADAKQQGFREIKWRAGGKTVSAFVRPRFLPLLKRFLELRKYILDEKDCEWLFIGGDKALRKHDQVSKGVLSKHYRLTAGIYPALSLIGGRKLRATMHEWYHRNVDPALTARITGHTPETIDKNYQAGTVGAHREEVTAFLDKVADRACTTKRILSAGEHLDGGVKGPLGECEKQGEPVPVSDDSPIKPDCKEIEGCLFCKRHAVKADEEDVRKLASCAYVIEQAHYFPGAESHFQPTLSLIDEYLSEIKEVLGTSDMVDRVTTDVYQNGNLDPYWRSKLALLDSIGVIL